MPWASDSNSENAKGIEMSTLLSTFCMGEFHFLTKSGFLKIKFTPEPVPAKLAPTGGRGIYKDLSFEVTRTRRAHLEADSREESAIGSFY